MGNEAYESLMALKRILELTNDGRDVLEYNCELFDCIEGAITSRRTLAEIKLRIKINRGRRRVTLLVSQLEHQTERTSK